MRWGLIYVSAIAVAFYGMQSFSADFSRYEVILQKKPFGDLAQKAANAVAVAAIKPNMPPPESPFKNLRLCAITDTVMGIRVGIVDIGINPAKSYSLKVGESEDGLTLLDADFEKEEVMMQKGEDKEWINMNGPTSGGGSGGMMASGAPSSIPGASPGAIVATTPESFADRLKSRREARIKAPPMEPPKMSDQELEKHLKEYQMQVIRDGDPPLPIELTPEMDAQLVKEGVLPPQ